ncbi:hypothetical protein MKW94_015070, partial [Papaver nudicaule]|nr:hypothetical protein [Papaver nudicaule]
MESRRDAIISAAANGELDRLKVMSFNNEKGIGVIHCAAAEGKLNVLDYLIQELGIDVDLKDERGDSLTYATVVGNMNTVEYLLGKGADPKMSNTNGYTPLHCAAEKGHTEILTRLLSRGVDVNALSVYGTPVGLAAKSGQLETLQILLDQNANPNLISGRSFTPLTGAIVSRLPQSLLSVELLLE